MVLAAADTEVIETTGTAKNIVPRPLAPPDVNSGCSDEDTTGEGDLFDAVEDILKSVEELRQSRAFPTLDTFADIDRNHDAYLGPTMESNWVLPGKLLVGAYPASMNDSHHAQLLCTILLQGVSTFVCLQQEYRNEGVTEEMWRSGEALRPYFQDVLQLLQKLRELREADPRSVPALTAPDHTAFVHFPIVDCNVADDTKVLQLAARLATRVARGEVLYLHCWGGHGRTGTVVSIMLHLMYGIGAEQAMQRCQHVHDVRRIPISVGSPQTEAQREQVRRVVAHLERRTRRTGACGPSNATSATVGDQKQVQQAVVDITRENCKAYKSTIVTPAAGSKSTEEGFCGMGSGGRRGWIRGRRQAFAQAPNGVGEDVSGWLPTEDSSKQMFADLEKACEGASRQRSEQSSSGSSSLRDVDTDGESRGPQQGSSAQGLQRARRKSFTKPYSEEEASRVGRLTRLRRRSSPSLNCPQLVASETGENGKPACLSASISSPTTGKRGLSAISLGASDGCAASPGSCQKLGPTDVCGTSLTMGGTGGAGVAGVAGHALTCSGRLAQ